MKVTVQNGATHGLSRQEVESMVPLFPPSWSKHVKHIVLYQGDGPEVTASFYPKEQILGLFWPDKAASAPKTEGVRELLVALSVVKERGELPARLSASLRKRHQSEVAHVLSVCLPRVAADAG